MIYLNDKQFLKEICSNHSQEKYVKVISYDFNGLPRETLEGKCLNGTINIDGKSSVRRTCSLQFSFPLEEQFHDFYWSLTTQFQLFIGLKNNTLMYQQYPIIWFPMGWFLISSFQYSISINNYTISLNGKDKMCLLNGEFGGTFTNLSTILNKKDILNNNGEIIETVELTIPEIIKNIVCDFGNVPEHKVQINDLDIQGKELLQYQGDTPMYILVPIGVYSDETKPTPQVIINEDQIIRIGGVEYQINDSENIVYLQINDQIGEINAPTEVTLKGNDEIRYNIIKIELGDTAGYRTIPLTYPGDFIISLNETVTSALDKLIKNILGDAYEYFFDIDQNFIFQKKNYISPFGGEILSLENGIKFNDLNNNMNQLDIAYNIDNLQEIVQISNTINLQNIKNDFSIWGKKNDVPVHLRFALDLKPEVYKNYEGTEFTDHNYDWREIIYQMALDQSKNGNKEDFKRKLILNNKDYQICQNGTTGYEQYYTDMLSFWRNIYNPSPEPNYELINIDYINNYSNDNIYVDTFEEVAINDLGNLTHEDKLNMYVISKDDDKYYLQKWYDEIDFLGLDWVKGDNRKNIYYFQGKEPRQIMESVKEIANNETFYIGNKNMPTIYYQSEKIDKYKDHIYLSKNKNSKNYQKLRDYFSILTYVNEDVSLNNLKAQRFFIKSADIIKPIDSFWLNNTTCIWSYSPYGANLTERTIEVIVQALKNYSSILSYEAEGESRVSFAQGEEQVCIYVERDILPEYNLFFKNDLKSKDYIPLPQYLFEEDLINFDKWNVYYKKNNVFVKSVDLIPIDKTQIYYCTEGNIYVPMIDSISMTTEGEETKNYYKKILGNKMKLNGLNARDELLPLYVQEGKNDYNKYFQSYKKTITGNKYYDTNNNIITEKIKYYNQYYDFNLCNGNDYRNCWNKKIDENFNEANFWLEFFDENHIINKYNIQNIGRKTQNINNNLINGINFKDNHKIHFYLNEYIEDKDAELHVQLNDKLFKLFVQSPETLSAIQALNSSILTSFINFDNISGSMKPLYFLNINDIVSLNDINNTITGQYRIFKYTIPLNYNGLVQFQAQKIF